MSLLFFCRPSRKTTQVSRRRHGRFRLALPSYYVTRFWFHSRRLVEKGVQGICEPSRVIREDTNHDETWDLAHASTSGHVTTIWTGRCGESYYRKLFVTNGWGVVGSSIQKFGCCCCRRTVVLNHHDVLLLLFIRFLILSNIRRE